MKQNIIDEIKRIVDSKAYRVDYHDSSDSYIDFSRSYNKIIEDFRNCQNIDWDRVSYLNQRSEEFIREFADEVVWYYIFVYQKLSESFIREFFDRINYGGFSNWKYIYRYQKLSPEFIEEFKEQLMPHINEEYTRMINV